MTELHNLRNCSLFRRLLGVFTVMCFKNPQLFMNKTGTSCCFSCLFSTTGSLFKDETPKIWGHPKCKGCWSNLSFKKSNVEFPKVGSNLAANISFTALARLDAKLELQSLYISWFFGLCASL